MVDFSNALRSHAANSSGSRSAGAGGVPLASPPVLLAASMGRRFGPPAAARWPGRFRAMLLLSGGRSDLVAEAIVEHSRSLVPDARHQHLPAADTAFTPVVLNHLAVLSAASHPGGPPR